MLGAVTLAKIATEAAAMTASAVAGILGAADSNLAVTVTAITATLGFAGLLVRQVMASQKALWNIIRYKDEELETERDINHVLRWEADKLRYTYNETGIDPGPYRPRRPAQTATPQEALT